MFVRLQFQHLEYFLTVGCWKLCRDTEERETPAMKQGLKNLDQDLLGIGKQMVEVRWIRFWPEDTLCASAT